MAFLKWLGIGLVVLVVAFGTLLISARFADGPLAIVAGGEFSTGELYTGAEPDWSFVKDISEIEFQSLEPVRSRTTWVVEVDGRAFIPCGYMNSWWGRIWKQWPIEIEQDPRVVVRIGDTLYERDLVRIQDDPVVPGIISELSRKYAPGLGAAGVQAVEAGSLWIFELAPRA
jgi:hypothetical protein